MKNSTIFKLLLTAAAALFLFTIIFLHSAKRSEDDTQSVFLVVEPFPQTEDVSQEPDTALVSNISAPEKKETADGETQIDDGFDLADELLPPDLYLEQIEDFREKVEKEAKRRQELDENNAVDETDYTDYDNDSYFDHSDNDSDNSDKNSSSAPAKSVIIDTDFASDADDTLGFLQNIQGLMNSKPDQYSPLTGLELIKEKVDTLYITGGNSTGKPSFNFYWTGDKVINAARDVANSFPARIVFLQSDLSDDTFCGQFYQTKDPNRSDIVTKALFANDQYGGVVAWDVFSVWCAAQDMNGSLDASFLELEQGSQYISHTGATQWTAEAAGSHYKMYKHMQGSYYSQIMNAILLDKFNRK